ncbi:MAG TPA: hypothetical protein VMU04_20545 [Candidatus Acidoferrum sp.]|nr:hypothetical protein [Candidatus Acidoferrum sp.]
MKASIITAFVVTTAVSVFAQGTVVFVGNSYAGTQHIWGPSSLGDFSFEGSGSNDHNPNPGTLPFAECGMTLIGAGGLTKTGPYSLGASTTLAQLLAANGADQPASLLEPSGQTTTFRTGAEAGLTVLITDTLQNIPKDSPAATFEVVAWDDSSGMYPTWAQASLAWMAALIYCGMSGPFTVQSIGGDWNTPPAFDYPSFNLYLIPEPSTSALAALGTATGLMLRRRLGLRQSSAAFGGAPIA